MKIIVLEIMKTMLKIIEIIVLEIMRTMLCFHYSIPSLNTAYYLSILMCIVIAYLVLQITEIKKDDS